MMSSEVGKWSSKNVTVGQEFVVSLDDGNNYRAVVMLAGGWTKGDECSWVDQVPKRVNLKNNKYTRMVRGSGQFFAVALCRIPDIWDCTHGGADISDEKTFSSWRPNFITGKPIIGFWADYKVMMLAQIKDIKAKRRAEADESALARAAAATIIEMVVPTKTQVVMGAATYNAASEMRQRHGISWNDEELRLTRKGVQRLASLIANSSSGAGGELTDLLQQVQAENAALRQRVEAAEEKVNALRFILNQ